MRAPASASTDTALPAVTVDDRICAERVLLIVLKPSASAPEYPLEADTPPANERMRALVAPAPSPACTSTVPAVTPAPTTRASVTSAISFTVTVPAKPTLPSAAAPEAATDIRSLVLLACTCTVPAPTLTVVLFSMAAVLPAARVVKAPAPEP